MILKYNKSTTDNAIFIKVFSDGTVFYITVSNDHVFNSTNNETEFTEIRRVFEEDFDINYQEVSVLKYLNLWIIQYLFVFNVDKTDHIMKLINEWLPTGKFRKDYKTFR